MAKATDLPIYREAYKWLSEQLGMPRKDTHIGMFDVDQCKRVVEICKPYLRGAR